MDEPTYYFPMHTLAVLAGLSAGLLAAAQPCDPEVRVAFTCLLMRAALVWGWLGRRGGACGSKCVRVRCGQTESFPAPPRIQYACEFNTTVGTQHVYFNLK